MRAPEQDANGGCGRLADFLQAHKASLLKQWLARTRADSAIQSDSLSRLELVDHVPGIFDALVQALRHRCSETQGDVQEITARHAVIRWVQRYDLRAVLREVSLLRTEFIRQLISFDKQDGTLGSEARLLNAMTVHRILDDIVMDATDTFLKLEGRSDGDAADDPFEHGPPPGSP
jgi:hypothetical protein